MPDSFALCRENPFTAISSKWGMNELPTKTELPKVLLNLILTGPSETQTCLDVANESRTGIKMPYFVKKEEDGQNQGKKRTQIKSEAPFIYGLESKQEDDARVKAKITKKGKRDGENIRTYARYDSVIQSLEQELSLNKIIPTDQDRKLLDLFDMKSKRSLQRFFFYLLLAKREQKLTAFLPQLKQKIRAKVQQKGGHRTQEFLSSLQSCVEKYIQAAESLQKATNLEEARLSFCIAYLDDQIQVQNGKKPHHNKTKGIDKCLEIYKIIMKEKKQQDGQQNNMEMEQEIDVSSESQVDKKQESPIIQVKTPPFKNLLYEKIQKRRSFKDDDQSFSMSEEELLDRTNQKRKKTGSKNKKQDYRDIQKYAKFDIVSESSLQFLKKQKMYKNIPQICKKLSHRSLHFFFVILAMIQKQKKHTKFLNFLNQSYLKKVQKRYTQRSEYFRERLYQSFQNLIEATRRLFQGKLDEALQVAYQVNADKKPHPAKASQQKKCKEIYKATKNILQGGENKIRLQNLIVNEKNVKAQQIQQTFKKPVSYIQYIEEEKQKIENQLICPILIFPSFENSFHNFEHEELKTQTSMRYIKNYKMKIEPSHFFVPIKTSSIETCGLEAFEQTNNFIQSL